MKLGWWAPWEVSSPWLPRAWQGTDEWHNPAVSVVVPFLGAFHIWFRSWRDGSDGHFSTDENPDCPVCQVVARDEALPRGWWWNPPRPPDMEVPA